MAKIHYNLESAKGGEFSLCGMAFDAYGSGDSDEEIVFARPGEKITCADCLRIIAECKSIKGGRAP